MSKTTYNDLPAAALSDFRETLQKPLPENLSGLCGFDGFIDTFIRVEQPASMAEFGPKVAAAAGVAASYSVKHLGDKFGGNGPLYASGLNDILDGEVDVTYIGAMGRDAILPIYLEALESKTRHLYSLADPAHSDCLEFTDGKVMLCDLRACGEITLERLLEVVGEAALDENLMAADFVAAVNWGKLVHVGEIWSYLASRSQAIRREAKEVHCFMDLAEFEGRPNEDLEDLLSRLGGITRQFKTMLSFNLKEAWQMGSYFGQDFGGKKDPESVAALATLLKTHIEVDRIIIHPNDGAACASEKGTFYVPGPYCKEPLISTGAGDNFGAGCLAAALCGLDDAGIILAGNLASGHFVRSGSSATFEAMVGMLDAWEAGQLGERL
jgi:sugar/nucleoside kinase (ribokinase family)